jgi:hypothetical protein
VNFSGIAAALCGSLAIAAVSTLGDFIWAAWIPSHHPSYGLIHGTVLFACIGLFLGLRNGKPRIGLLAGALIGALAAASFYGLAGVAGRSAMFIIWMAVWVAVSFLNGRLRARRFPISEVLARGIVAALVSGVVFYLVSGIWFPFRPRGWDYVWHFAAWTLAYLPVFGAMLVTKHGAVAHQNAAS